MEIGIIGAGIGGLATAVRLAAAGHRVTVFERNSFAGGKLSEFQMEGYRFDAGPSLFTMPQFVEALFEVAGKQASDYFTYQSLPVACHYFWEDGTRFQSPTQADAFSQAAAATFAVPSRRVAAYLRDSRRKYDITSKVFLFRSLHRLSSYLNTDFVRGVLHIPVLDIFTSMNRVNERYLRHPKLVQLFNRYATYNGSNPYQAPGILTSIPHLEHGIGTFFPHGGMHAITQSVLQLGRDLGVAYHFDTPIDQILTEGKRATGVRTAQGDTFLFDKIVSNMDVYFTYRHLLPHAKAPERILRQPKSSSALIFYWGMCQIFPALGLHNIFFANDYRREFEAIFSQHTVADDPTIYINITSKCLPTDAPEGGENWFVMVNVPHDSGQDWDSLIAATRQRVLTKLSRILNIDIAPLIACEQLLHPRTIESRTASHLGALYGNSSNNRSAAFGRHPNFSPYLRDLYFCGGSVHPGGGIPLALLSGKIVAELID